MQEAQYNVMYLVDTNGDGKYEAYIKAKISGVDQIISLGSIIDLSDFYTKSEIDTALAGKQPLLTWDNVPTSGSSNAISSGAIYTALDKIKIEEMTDAEYAALATKDPDKVYFVYEAEEDNRTVIAYDSNGDFMYTLTMYGCAASGISIDSKITTPPTITGPDHFGSGAFIFEATFADGNTYYFSSLFTDGRTGYAMSNNAAHIYDAYGTNLFFAINGNRFTLMSAPNVAWVSSIHISGYDENSFEYVITPKPNGFRRIYKGDELYATNELPDITPHVELTQSQYDALQNPDPNTEYFITNADASGDFSSIEDRMTAIEDEYTIVYMDGNVRIPLYTRNVYKVVRVDGNTVEWYIAEPTSQRNFKATVTATGSAGTRTNPTVTVTEVV